MLNSHNVKLIFLREVKDQLRDRRTLFMVAVLPLLLYPALGIGMMQLTVLFREQPRTVVMLGAGNLPASPALLDGHRFAGRWFPKTADPNRLVVVTESSDGHDRKGLPEKLDPELLLKQAQEVRSLLDGIRTLKAQAAEEGLSEKELRPQVEESRRKAGELFGQSGIQVLVIVPDGLSGNLNRVEELLTARGSRAEVPTGYARPEIIYNKADEKSQITFDRVTTVFENWESAILGDWLKLADLDAKFTHPVVGDPVDISLTEQIAASLWGRMFPALLVIMSITGAFYPAIDLVAGEKERGTMETLLICPATRTEIVLGKFFTVMLFSCTTALLNLFGMGLTGRHIASMAPTGPLANSGGIGLPPLAAVMWIVVLLVPLAALFSALCLALATFARSSKEGQYYLTPLLMVTLGLTMFCLSPGVELTPQFSLLPVAGVALLLKGLLLSPLHAGALYAYVPPVLISSVVYSALALWWAIDQFQREEVLFREAERFELKLWIRHLLRDKEPNPSFGEACFCFMVIMMLQFFAMRFLKQKLDLAAAGGDVPRMMMHLMLVQQLAIIASPALMMGLMLTTSLKETFGLRWPGWPTLAVAVILPLALTPLATELQNQLKWVLGDLPEGAAQAMALMSDPNQPFWLVLLTLAIAPAFCEEVAFRGFILHGFSRGGRVALAIGLSAFAFGAMHMIPHQVLNGTLMGLVLGALAMRSRSLFPAMLFHFVNNGMQVLLGQVESLPVNPFVTREEGHEIVYHWPTLLIAAVVAVWLIRWIIQPLRRSPGRGARGSSASPEDLIGRATRYVAGPKESPGA